MANGLFDELRPFFAQSLEERTATQRPLQETGTGGIQPVNPTAASLAENQGLTQELLDETIAANRRLGLQALGERMDRIVEEQENNPAFIDRIFVPDLLDPLQDEQGRDMTHLLSTFEQDGKHFVVPLIQDFGDELRLLPPEAAFERAKRRKDFLEFDSAEEAEFFSKNYKALNTELFKLEAGGLGEDREF